MASDPSTKGARRVIRIGKYEVLAHIATGGMGAVYRAIDTELNREVALKVLAPEMAANANTLERFHREARHSSKLNHENIVTLFEFGEANGTHFLAMEYVDGIDLHDYIDRKGQLDSEESRQMMIQAARALEHASQQGIVHRDIKPSNFLLAKKDDQFLVKLTDMGLAREAQENEFRVTRDGSTVGTVDYLSPEQARDSRAADIRSDIYSLGCTLYHMLAGKPPFPVGSLAERIFKHIQVEPPDIRQFNPQVSEPFWDILKRMLAKDPAKRYQTPAELVKDLELLDILSAPPREIDENAELDLLEEDELEEPPLAPETKPPSKDTGSDPDRRRVATAPRLAQAKKVQKATRARQDTAERAAAKTRPILTQKKPFPLLAGGIAAVVALIAIVALVVILWPARSQPTQPSDDPDQGHPKGNDAEPELLAVAPRLAPETRVFRPGAPWPLLYPQADSIDPVRLREEFEKLWASPSPVVDKVLRVRRGARGSSDEFPSLAEAAAAAPAGKTTAIEVHDNGPLFELPVALSGRHVILRAGKGYRPLLVWDIDHSRANGGKESVFLSLQRGNLTLQGLDVALQWNDAPGMDRPALVQVSNGDFLAQDCTFSVAGKSRSGVALLRMDGSEAPGKKCRLSRCVARGDSLIMLDLEALGAEVLLDGCLIAGGDHPLFKVSAAERPQDRKLSPATLRVMRSTLVSNQTLLQVRGAGPADKKPALNWRGWDALLARSGSHPIADMVSLVGEAGADGIQWQATNCLYSGWKNLLAGRETISAENHTAWQQRWKLPEGDLAIGSRWPALVPTEPAEATPEYYRTEDTPAAYLASAGPGTLGCDLAALPPVRDNWLTLTYRRLAVPSVDLLTDEGAPEIPGPGHELYHGERLDLGVTDLGAHLEKQLRSGKKLGPRVVFHLHGSGVHKISPIKIKGSSLVLYFELPERKAGAAVLPPLVLISAEASAEALIDIEDGDLEITRGEIHCPDSRLALLPRHLLRVRGGTLSLFGTRLQGPLTQPPERFQGLIRLEGPEKGKPDATTGGSIHRSVLLSGKAGISVAGTRLNLRLHQSVLVTRQEAFHLDPGYSPRKPAPALAPELNVQCLVEHTTVASQRSVLHLEDAPSLAVPTEPILFQARASAFLNPFAGPQVKEPHPTIFLLHEGNALARGLLLWRGEGNVMDPRLHYFAVPAGSALPSQMQPHAYWARLWGTPGCRQALVDLPLKARLEANLSPLENLALVNLPRLDRPPGADLTLLGILKSTKPK